MMYVEFEKNFSHADVFERPDGSYSHFGLSEPKNGLIPNFLGMMYVEFMKKIFFSPIRASWCGKLESFWAQWAEKTFWFLLSRYDVRRVQKNFLLSDSRELLEC